MNINRAPTGRRRTATSLLYALIFASVAVRSIGQYLESRPDSFAVPAVLLSSYILLLVTEARVSSHFAGYVSIYFIVQTAITFALLVLSPALDYFVLLFIPLCVRAMQVAELRIGYFWIALFTAVTAVGLLLVYSPVDAAPFILIYAAVFGFVVSYGTATRRAEAAQQESHHLLMELREAHRRLQELAEQSKVLAVTDERNRLSRDLHDSVAQALYSLVLYSEAASRQLNAGALDVTAEHLVELRQTAQQALQEMRLLVFELRPLALEEEGLAAAIRARLEAVERRAGLKYRMDVDGERRLPAGVEEGLYRLTQESLNNVLKHAQATEVNVKLSFEGEGVTLMISDDGKGFELDEQPAGSGLGLTGMRERAQGLPAELTVSSSPGSGTVVTIEVAG